MKTLTLALVPLFVALALAQFGPAAEMRAFDRLVGTWSGQGEYVMTAGAEAVP